MNTDEAYALGLVVGGGVFSGSGTEFYIRLPYRQWGDVSKNPAKAGQIGNDIFKVVRPVMQSVFGLQVSFNPSGKEWQITCNGSTSNLVKRLASYNIAPSSDLRKTADLSAIIKCLLNDNFKRRFIAGLADTIGSVAPSHRRFSDDVQIISFEIPGFNFKFICQLCNLLYSIGCIPDQILWQHPNMQSGADRYYPQWRKGNKLRVTLDAFSTFGSMAFKSKFESALDNRNKETSPNPRPVKCEDAVLRPNGITAKHVEDDCPGLPASIRGGVYIHHKHICAVLGCPHAPVGEVVKLIREAPHYVMPFTVLHKGTLQEIEGIISNEQILANRKYTRSNFQVRSLFEEYSEKRQTVRFNRDASNVYRPSYSNSKDVGYPVNELMDAVAFIIASQSGNLNGKRVRGSRDKLVEDAISRDSSVSVEIRIPDLLTPLIVTDGKNAAMVGPMNAEVYGKLISPDKTYKYKIRLRDITENDLK